MVTGHQQPLAPRRALTLRRVAALSRSMTAGVRVSRAHVLPTPSHLPAAHDRPPARPPVFVIAAGWRSGSTAVQRLVVSGGEAFLWGEPYPTSMLLARLLRVVVESSVCDGQAARVIRSSELDASLSRSWLATSNPEVGYLLDGVRALMTTTYWRPLIDTQFATWGTKEVALTPGQLDLLMALFPDAHFVCLVRNPTDAYLSFREFVVNGVVSRGGRRGYVAGPIGFAHVWSRLACHFRTIRDLPNVSTFRYEDIDGDVHFPDLLGKALDMSLDPAVWQLRIGATRHVERSHLAGAELAVVARLTAAERRNWGYDSCPARPSRIP